MQATAEGLPLGTYRFDRYRTTAKDLPKLDPQGHRAGRARSDAKAVRAASIAAASSPRPSNWARDLVNTPAGDAAAGDRWPRGAEDGRGGRASVQGLGRGRARRRAGSAASSASARQREPAAHDRAHATRGRRGRCRSRITGKGITFDSGGLSIKDAERHGDDEGRHGRRGGDRSPRCARSRC